MMDTVYPPVGIAHITKNVSDLFRDRLEGARSIKVAVVFQPKSNPHFGTLFTLFSAFALAHKLADEFKIPCSVLLDTLDNAPGETSDRDGVEYSRCLSHVLDQGVSRSELFLQPVLRLAMFAEKASGISFHTRGYRDIQAQESFRDGLVRIIRDTSKFSCMFAPSDLSLRVRVVCPHCGLVEKKGLRTGFDVTDNSIVVSSICPDHGEMHVDLSGADGVVDLNAPIRTVLRSLCFARERKERRQSTIVLNGGDWAGAWMQRVYFDGLSALGCYGLDVPFNLFCPQLLDSTGAKLSKTIYLRSDAYSHIDECWLTTTAFFDRFGDAGFAWFWSEISSWLSDPKKFFRNYTLEFIVSRFLATLSSE